MEITLLGGFLARWAGTPVDLRLSRQTLRLRAYLLVVRARTHTREHVAFTMWPDEREADARAKLRRQLHLLQRALPESRIPWIVSSTLNIVEEAHRRLRERTQQHAAIARLLELAAAVGDPELLLEALRRNIVLLNANAEREAESSAIDELVSHRHDAPGRWPAIVGQLKGS